MSEALDIALEWAPARELMLHDDSIELPMPDVPEHLAWIWRAYNRLEMDRQWMVGGMSAAIPCRIPWQSIVDWAQFHGYDEDDHAMLDACIVGMDTIYLKHQAKKRG